MAQENKRVRLWVLAAYPDGDVRDVRDGIHRGAALDRCMPFGHSSWRVKDAHCWEARMSWDNLPEPDFGHVDRTGLRAVWLEFKGIRVPLLVLEIPVHFSGEAVDGLLLARFGGTLCSLRPRLERGNFAWMTKSTVNCVPVFELSGDSGRIDALESHDRFARRGTRAWVCTGGDDDEFTVVDSWFIQPEASAKEGVARFDAHAVVSFYARIHARLAVVLRLSEALQDHLCSSIVPGAVSRNVGLNELLQDARALVHANSRLGDAAMLRNFSSDQPVVEYIGRQTRVKEEAAAVWTTFDQVMQVSTRESAEHSRRSAALAAAALVFVNVVGIVGAWASVLQVLDNPREPVSWSTQRAWLLTIAILLVVAVSALAGLAWVVASRWGSAPRYSLRPKGLLGNAHAEG